MQNIVINLDEPCLAPTVDATLLELVLRCNTWPIGATCAVQESDGGICWWANSLAEVEIAKGKAESGANLSRLLGLGNQVLVEYVENDGQPVCAADWKESIITYDEFLKAVRD